MSQKFDATMKTINHPIWDCRQAKAEIALKAGGDSADPVAAEGLESHLTNCEDCRRYLRRMRASLEALQACALHSLPPAHQRSLWPGLASRLPPSVRPSAAARFNVWVPTAAMAVACAAMLLVTIVQIERVIPVEPTVTPQLNLVLRRERERDLFPQFPTQQLRLVKEPAAASSVPVKLDYAPRFDPAARDREW